jgi:hypothetical protein
MTSTEENGAAMSTMSTMSATDIAHEILVLPWTDQELTLMANAVRARRKQNMAAKTIGLKRGDYVKIGGNAPSKEHGGVVIVRRVNEKTMTVLPESPAFVGTKYAHSRSVRVPLSWIGEVI